MTTLNENIIGSSPNPSEILQPISEADENEKSESWGIPLSNEDYIEIARRNNAIYKESNDGNYFLFRTKEEAVEFLRANSKIYVPNTTFDKYSDSLIQHHPPPPPLSRQERRALQRQQNKCKK